MTSIVILVETWEFHVMYTGPHGFSSDRVIEVRDKAVQADTAPKEATEFYYYDQAVVRARCGTRDFWMYGEKLDRSVTYVINGRTFDREGLKDLMERLKGKVPDTEGLLKYWGAGPAPVYTLRDRDSQLVWAALGWKYDQVVRDRQGFFRKFDPDLDALVPTS